MAPDAAVVELIAAAGISGLTKATTLVPPFNGNLLRARMLDAEENVPGAAVFVSPLPGRRNDRLCGVTSDDREEVVQVEVRGGVRDPAGALDLARSLLEALHCADASAHGYWSCSVAQPQPDYRGDDVSERSIYALTVDLRRVT